MINREDILEEIILRREYSGDMFWSRVNWDYTEWEEVHDELRHKLKETRGN